MELCEWQHTVVKVRLPSKRVRLAILCPCWDSTFFFVPIAIDFLCKFIWVLKWLLKGLAISQSPFDSPSPFDSLGCPPFSLCLSSVSADFIFFFKVKKSWVKLQHCRAFDFHVAAAVPRFLARSLTHSLTLSSWIRIEGGRLNFAWALS